MKKKFLLIILGVFSLLGYSQNLSKHIPTSKECKGTTFLQGAYNLPNKRILLVFNLKEYIKIELYDEEFNQLDKRDILDIKNSWGCTYVVQKNSLYITHKEKKQEGFTLIKVDLDNKIDIKKYLISNGKEYSIIISESNDMCYYKTDEYMSSLNFETKQKTKLKIKLEDKEEVFIETVTTFPENKNVAFYRTRTKKIGKPVIELVVHDSLGEEIFVCNQFVKDKYLVTNNFVTIDGDIYMGGNYSNKELINNIFIKPTYDGVFLKKINSKENFDKFYEFSDFPALSSLISTKKKDVKDQDHFGFSLENIISLKNEKMVIGKFYKYEYGFDHDQQRNELSYKLLGVRLKYILVFGINDLGEILWHDAVEIKDLDIYIPKYQDLYKQIIGLNMLNIEKENDVIKCHFYYNPHIINYFEIKSNKVVNKQEFEYAESIRRHTKYWYDDYYFHYEYKSKPIEGIKLNRIKFK
jgi:hypothetical protein